MDTKSVWELLSAIPIGTIVAWVIVLATIIAAICTGAIKLYKLFVKYKKIKDDNKEMKEDVRRHDEQILVMNDKLDNVINILQKQNEENRVKLRHSIVRAAEEAIKEGRISIRKFRSLHEMYEIYHQPDENGEVGNGYVTTLMAKVDVLPIVGHLDKNNEDVE